MQLQYLYVRHITDFYSVAYTMPARHFRGYMVGLLLY